MATEIEHKFLVVNDSYQAMAVSSVEIEQGYLNREPDCTVRVRVKDGHGYITVKGKNAGDARLEFEYEIPLADARAMLGLCISPVISKRRWIVPYEGHTWEVDEFHGSLSPLIVAEIELPSSDTRYILPPFVGENVTGDPSYYNSNLGK